MNIVKIYSPSFTAKIMFQSPDKKKFNRKIRIKMDAKRPYRGEAKSRNVFFEIFKKLFHIKSPLKLPS